MAHDPEGITKSTVRVGGKLALGSRGGQEHLRERGLLVAATVGSKEEAEPCSRGPAPFVQ